MEAGSHVAHPHPHLPATCSPRLARLGQTLEPLLPGMRWWGLVERIILFIFTGKDNKRKRLNAVLDKLASNITKAPDEGNEGPAEELAESPEKRLELEINVKTKIKKEESSENTSGESDESGARSPATPPKSESGHPAHSNLTNNTFFNSLLLNSPKCDKKQEVGDTIQNIFSLNLSWLNTCFHRRRSPLRQPPLGPPPPVWSPHTRSTCSSPTSSVKCICNNIAEAWRSINNQRLRRAQRKVKTFANFYFRKTI